MIDRSISFLPEFIGAILRGEKTETRRMNGLEIINEFPEKWLFSHWARESDRTDRLVGIFKGKRSLGAKSIACPFGCVGSRLVVDKDILLHIDEINMNHLGEISEEEAKAEGCRSQDHFFEVFEKIYSYEQAAKNPWLWVIKFHLL